MLHGAPPPTLGSLVAECQPLIQPRCAEVMDEMPETRFMQTMCSKLSNYSRSQDDGFAPVDQIREMPSVKPGAVQSLFLRAIRPNICTLNIEGPLSGVHAVKPPVRCRPPILSRAKAATQRHLQCRKRGRLRTVRLSLELGGKPPFSRDLVDRGAYPINARASPELTLPCRASQGARPSWRWLRSCR